MGELIMDMIKSGFKNYVNYKLNQLQVESTTNRINQWLNLLMVESTYGCKESQKSKKVKNPPKRRTLALYHAKVPHASRIPGPACTDPHRAPYRVRIRAGELEAASWTASWELGAEAQAANWEQAVKYILNKMYVHF